MKPIINVKLSSIPSQEVDGWQSVPSPPGVEVLSLEKLPRIMQSAYRALHAEGGRILVVGGAVRDAVLGLNPKDHDFEVYGLSWNQVLKVLSPLGRVNEVGKSFGIIKLTSPHSKDLDISFPLRENVTGRGYRGIESKIDPTITPREAASTGLLTKFCNELDQECC